MKDNTFNHLQLNYKKKNAHFNSLRSDSIHKYIVENTTDADYTLKQVVFAKN